MFWIFSRITIAFVYGDRLLHSLRNAIFHLQTPATMYNLAKMLIFYCYCKFEFVKEVSAMFNGVWRWHMEWETILSWHRYLRLQHWKLIQSDLYIYSYINSDDSVVYSIPDAFLSSLGSSCSRWLKEMASHVIVCHQ